MTKLALKHDTVLQGDENEIFEQLILFLYKREKQQLKSLRGEVCCEQGQLCA